MLCLVEYKLGSWERPPILSTISKSSHRFLPIIQPKVNKVLRFDLEVRKKEEEMIVVSHLDIVIVCWAELMENEVKVRDWTEVDSELLSVRTDGLLLKALGYVACRSGDSAENSGNDGEDIISNLRNGAAAENALAIMQERGFSNPRRSRHWLTPGTVKFVAFHVLSLEGSNGLTILGVAEKIQKSGLRDLTTSKTPEASIVAALSRDLKLFERTTPSTYCVQDAEDVEHDDVERDEDSESDIAEDLEADDLGTELKPNNEALSCEANRYLAKTLPADGKDTYHDKVMETPKVGVKNLGDSSPLMQSEGYKERVNYNVHTAKLLDGGRNKAAIEFAISLIQTLLINDSKVISKLDNFFDALQLGLDLQSHYNSWLRLPGILLPILLLFLLFLLGRIIPDKLQSRRPQVSL
ncbi:unnamed protein product [Camellia sinensis]